MAYFNDHYKALRQRGFKRAHNSAASCVVLNLRRDGVVVYELEVRLPHDPPALLYTIARLLHPDKTEYSKWYGDADIAEIRRLVVQFWKDGQHRVSHYMVDTDNSHCYSMSTPPTEFSTVEEMLKAIEQELTRTDHTNPGVVAARTSAAISTGN